VLLEHLGGTGMSGREAMGFGLWMRVTVVMNVREFSVMAMRKTQNTYFSRE
jgi:hypothetical protein